MKRAIAVVTAFMLAAPAVWSVETMAQTQQPPAPSGPTVPGQAPGMQKKQAPGVQKEQEVQGTIKSVDPSGKEVTLEDGTKLMIPDKMKITKAALKEGAIIKASYREEGGQKVVTRISVADRKS